MNFERATLSLDTLIEVVCAVFITTPEQLAQRGRHRHAARDAAVFMAREWLGLPLDDIATRFQMRTRSSVSEALRRSRSREEQDAGFRVQLATIRERLREGSCREW